MIDEATFRRESDRALESLKQSLIAAEDDASAHCHGLCRLRAMSQHREFFSFLSGEVERFGGTSDTHASV